MSQICLTGNQMAKLPKCGVCGNESVPANTLVSVGTLVSLVAKKGATLAFPSSTYAHSSCLEIVRDEVKHAPLYARKVPKPRKVAKDGLGSPRIQITVGILDGEDFGRLAIRTGTTDAELVADYAAFVRSEIARGNADLVRKLKAEGAEALRVAYQRWRNFEAPVLTAKSGNLGDVLDRWVEGVRTTKRGKPHRPATLRLYRQCVERLKRFAHPNEDISKLPDVVLRCKKDCEAKGYNFPFNHTITTALRYAQDSDRRGRFSPLYIAVAQIGFMHTDRKEERDSTCTPRRAKALMLIMQRQGNGHLAHHVWNYCALACRPEEYLNAQKLVTLWPDRNAAVILGTKNETSKRIVPCIGVTFPSYLAETIGRRKSKKHVDQAAFTVHTLRSFRKALTQASKGRYTPIDLRASGRTWYRLAGIDEIQAEIYHGHSMSEGDKRYQTKGNHMPKWLDWKDDVVRDAKKLQEYITKALSQRETDTAPPQTVVIQGVGEVRLLPAW